ncbi:RNA polymerase subunit sigma-24 [Virgisporangium aliadipatigenens]|uniref:RNA polymerase subunit sigma-24 n=1 Tax=Virgisporangium aliadipatigenens TaxID=741659 RepID=A0A8J3YV63_9ACTN|nr:RNA polymerase sigma factor [Virgisporangium aliadipatigenens]GIJ50391.1 RNA polymerase subunit sigma-24 [Virgisporangium aliadipatigenens]
MPYDPTFAGDEASIDDVARHAAAGDRAALDVLLRRIRPQVLHRCLRLLPCLQDAEEACQDTLLQVATQIHTFGGRSKFTTWLYVVVANCARQTYRSLKRRSMEQPGHPPQIDIADPRTTSVIVGSRLDFMEALEELSAERPELVTPLLLRDVCQLDYEEIAHHLGIPNGTLKSRIHAARQRVRASLHST